MERLSFEDQIQANKVKSFLLIAVIFAFFLILGYMVSMVLDPSYFFIIMIFSIVFSLIYIWAGYYHSDKIALASVRAKPASRTEHRMFYAAAENMSIASGLPMPRLYVMESEEINAFASGRNPRNAVISIIAEMFLRSLWFSSSGSDRGGRVQIFLIVLGILFAILAPIAAQLVSLAISRRREYTADATGVKFTRYPRGLADALRKIEDEHVSDRERKHRVAKAMAP